MLALILLVGMALVPVVIFILSCWEDRDLRAQQLTATQELKLKEETRHDRN